MITHLAKNFARVEVHRGKLKARKNFPVVRSNYVACAVFRPQWRRVVAKEGKVRGIRP